MFCLGFFVTIFFANDIVIFLGYGEFSTQILVVSYIAGCITVMLILKFANVFNDP